MKPPVFILGSPRSGTTLLYHMLLSAGGFAVYRSETHAFNLIALKFGNLGVAENKQRLLQRWLRSKFFQVSGLDAGEIQRKIMDECRSGGDFLRILMGEIARKQGVDRWADCTPEHLLYLREIKRELPDALVIHIIRDGRDVALSYAKQKWIHPLPWDKNQDVLVAGLHWEWMVRKGRVGGREIAPDYVEMHFEDLVNQPQVVLARLGEFIHHDLDYERIKKVSIGSVNSPNTSFESRAKEDFHPVGRFRGQLGEKDLARLEALIGGSLQEFGYALATPEEKRKNGFEVSRMQASYRMLFETKQWLKSNTPLRRLVSTALMDGES
jgi:Sulfotransferase family